MKILTKIWLRMASSGLLFAGAIVGSLPASAQQAAAPLATGLSQQIPAQLPDSPGAVSKAQADAPPIAPLKLQAQAVQPTQGQPAQLPTDEQQNQAAPSKPTSAQKPVGTAAAGAIPSGGIAASQPAGIAMAPAKQHRVRTIVLSVGAIIGAGVAVGTVIALTEATPGKPPGAH
jgi:hypothetical protein